MIQLLQGKGAEVIYNDPYVPQLNIKDTVLHSQDIETLDLGAMDCVVLATDHSCYDLEKIAEKSALLFDTRGATITLHNNNIVRLGEGIH